MRSITLDGANGTDAALGMVIDDQGNLYATGFVTIPGRGTDIWLAKFDSNLSLLLNITIDGSAHINDMGYMLELDSNGYLYLVGYIGEVGEGPNIFLAKFNASTLGLLKNITINGGANSVDEGYGILLNESGDLYITGTVTEPSEGYNIYIGKFDTELNLQKNITINGPANRSDKGRFLALSEEGNLFVSGSASQAGTGYDFWLGKFDTNLNIVCQKIIASPTVGEDKGYGITLDGEGTLYVTGTINNSIQGFNISLAKYDTNLNHLQNITLNGPVNGEDVAYSIFLDAGTIYQTGVYSETFALGGANIWIARYDINLNLQTYTTVNGSMNSYDTGYGIIKGLGQDFYVSGYVSETSGGINIWLARYRM